MALNGNGDPESVHGEEDAIWCGYAGSRLAWNISFASVGAGAGLGLPMIGALLGHTQAATTQRYAHLAIAPLQDAANLITLHIAEAMSKPVNEKVVDLKK